MAFVLPNLVFGVVSASFDTGDSQISLAAGHGARFGADFDLPGILWNWTDHPNPGEAFNDGDPDLEVILITGRMGDALTVSRGQEGTSAIAAKAGREYRIGVTATAAVWTSLFEGNGGLVTITATSYSVASGVQYVLVDDDTAGSAVTVTLPTAVGAAGRPITVKKLGTTAEVIVEGFASETIDRELNMTIAFQDDAMKVVSDGANWSIA